MYSTLVRHVLFPLHERLKGKPTFPWLHRLEESQWWSRERLLEYQAHRLRSLTTNAARHVPYYARLFAERGLAPTDIRSTDDLARLPCLTRAHLRDHFRTLQAAGAGPRSQRISTGGSTGEPVTVLVDMTRMGFGEGSRLRSHRWFGIEPGSREIVLWGSPIELGGQGIVRSLRDRLLNSRLLSAFDLGEPALARYAAFIDRYRPVKMYGYASALYLLARYVEARRWTPPTSLQAIFATAEPLFDFQRKTIEAAFRCRVAVEYGARDGGLIANECPDGGLHIPAEGIHVEIADADADGVGEIVVTILDSHVFPMIRYRTGDLGCLAPDSCRCGRSLPRLRSIEGRQTDFIVTPDHRCLHALALIYPLRDMDRIKSFQVLQERVDLVRVSVVPQPSFTRADVAAVEQKLATVLGDAIHVDVQTVDAIERTRSGKFRYVISKVAGTEVETMLRGRALVSAR